MARPVASSVIAHQQVEIFRRRLRIESAHWFTLTVRVGALVKIRAALRADGLATVTDDPGRRPEVFLADDGIAIQEGQTVRADQCRTPFPLAQPQSYALVPEGLTPD